MQIKLMEQKWICLPRIARARIAALQTPASDPADNRSSRSRKLSDASNDRRFSQQKARFPTVNSACRCTWSSTSNPSSLLTLLPFSQLHSAILLWISALINSVAQNHQPTSELLCTHSSLSRLRISLVSTRTARASDVKARFIRICKTEIRSSSTLAVLRSTISIACTKSARINRTPTAPSTASDASATHACSTFEITTHKF